MRKIWYQSTVSSMKRHSVENFSKKSVFLYRRQGNCDFEFPIKMSFFANLQNYRREFANSISNFILKNFILYQKKMNIF